MGTWGNIAETKVERESNIFWREQLQGEQLLPNKIIGGATSTSCSHIFFLSHLKVTLRLLTMTVRLLLTQKFWKIPQILGLRPKPHCTLCILFFRKIHIV